METLVWWLLIISGDLECYPLSLDILDNIVCYMDYLETKDEVSIMGEALNLSTNAKPSPNMIWTTNYGLTVESMKGNRMQALGKLQTLYTDVWCNNITCIWQKQKWELA